MKTGLIKTVLAASFVIMAFALGSAAQAVDSLFNWDDLAALKIYHAYSASDGRSYIEEIAIPSAVKQIGDGAAYIYFDLKPQAVRIGRSTHGSMINWHYAGESRHLIIPLQGDMVFDLGDGKLFHVTNGEAILAEDWTGKGHRSGCEALNKKTCVVIDILVEPNPRGMPLRAPPARR